jgi:hypothetical protein
VDYNKVGKYSVYWNYSNKEPYPRTAIGVITYDYTKNQTNQLLYHFSDEYPNEYLLRPSEVGRELWTDETYNPGITTSQDPRSGVNFKKTSDGAYYFAKYRPNSSVRTHAYEDDVCIYTFRTEDYIYMLFEALNGQGRYVAADFVMNNRKPNANDSENVILKALTNMSSNPDSCTQEVKTEWDGFTINWLDVGNGSKNPHLGIRGCLSLADRTLRTEQTEEARAYNDSLLALEYVLEFPAEGKIYPALIRLARRHNNLGFITDHVLRKYEAVGMADKVKAAIEGTNNGVPGYFVPWDLQVQ